MQCHFIPGWVFFIFSSFFSFSSFFFFFCLFLVFVNQLSCCGLKTCRESACQKFLSFQERRNTNTTRDVSPASPSNGPTPLLFPSKNLTLTLFLLLALEPCEAAAILLRAFLRATGTAVSDRTASACRVSGCPAGIPERHRPRGTDPRCPAGKPSPRYLSSTL